MAKATKLYFGYCSYGRSVEVAQRADDGIWFIREYGWNGYGNAWSKWEKMIEAPSHPKRLRCAVEAHGAPEYIELAEEEQERYLEFGFSTLHLYDGKPRVRLPNP